MHLDKRKTLSRRNSTKKLPRRLDEEDRRKETEIEGKETEYEDSRFSPENKLFVG